MYSKGSSLSSAGNGILVVHSIEYSIASSFFTDVQQCIVEYDVQQFVSVLINEIGQWSVVLPYFQGILFNVKA